MPAFSSSLKTTARSDEPRVLLIGAPAWFSAKVTEIFAAHEMPVVALSDSQFLGVEAGKIDAGSVYKILWWLDFDALEIESQVASALQEISQIPLVIAGRLPEAFLFEQESPSPELTGAQAFFEALTPAFPEAAQFFARDLIDEETLEQPLAFALRGYGQQLLLDPETKWFFSSIESFFAVIEPVLVRPHVPRRAIVRGRGMLSSTLLKKLADILTRYYHSSLEVSPVLARRFSPRRTDFVETTAAVDTEALLDALARNKKRWAAQAAILSSPLLDISRKTPAIALSSAPPQPLGKDLAPGQKRRRMNEGKRLVNREKIDYSALGPREEEKIEGELARIFQQKRTAQQEKRIDDKVKIVKKIAKKSRKNKALFYGGVVALSLGAVVLALWGMFAVSTNFARREIQTYFTDLLPVSAAPYQSGAWMEFLKFQTNIYAKTLGEGWLEEGGEVAKFDQALTQFQAEKKSLESAATAYFLGLVGRGETNPVFPPLLTQKMAAVAESEGQLLQMGETMSAEKTWLESLENSQQHLRAFSQLSEFFTSVFGGKNKRVYAVLMQNNLELRPTGGFIQAVGLLVFDKGLLVDSQVVNTYDLDAKLPGALVAPAEVKKYLGEDAWYLRDSNWNPDFPQSAERAAWFVRQATGIQVDGVWALNYSAFGRLLAAVGPLELTKYSESLTQNNLLERVEFHSDDELSQNGADRGYAAAILSQFLQHLTAYPPEKTPALLEAFGRALEEKNMVLFFTNQEEQETAKKMAWTGEVITPSCPTQFRAENCLVDQVFQVETNIGLNRVNAFIKHTVEHDVDLSGQKILHTRTVTFENTASSDGWPLGNYKAYIRFLLDQDAAPVSVAVNGRKLTGDAVALYTEQGRRVVGVPLEVPRQSQSTLELKYTTHAVPAGAFSFLLFDQKQSGVESTPTTITLHAPDKKPILIAPAAKIFGNTIEFQLPKNSHLYAGASFQ